MFDDIDLAELGLDEEKGAALKEALATKHQEALDAAVSGLKSKNSELLGTIKATKTELDQIKGQFDGLDIEAVKGLLTKVGQDEETKLIAEGKLDEVITRRTERLRADMDKRLSEANDRADKADAFANQFKDKVLNDSLRSAAIKAGVLPESTDDLVVIAKASGFVLDEHGESVAMSKDGEVILGKDAKTPLSAFEWMESTRETRPHFWPRAQGAGPTGDNGGRSSGKKRSDMTPKDKADYIQAHGQQAYLKLPK